ncbi:MAG TPA: hypothetical protein VGB44_09025 [Flavobacterium sp.]|jgi:hypothetical protein
MKTILIILTSSFILTSCGLKGINREEDLVYFIPTLHNIHEVNINYNYDSLRAYVKRVNPSVIAVEIRPEDISADTLYLKNNYPLEMRQMRYWFPETTVVGFDWLGEEIAGKPIPDNYWKNISPIKKLQRELSQDSIFLKTIKSCYHRKGEREAILRTSTLKTLVNSVDAEIVTQEYNCFEEKANGTKYIELSKNEIKKFYRI